MRDVKVEFITGCRVSANGDVYVYDICREPVTRCGDCCHYSEHGDAAATCENTKTVLLDKDGYCSWALPKKSRFISPAEAAARLRLLDEMFDTEEKHVMADTLLCEILEQQGYGEAVAQFENMGKWYS